MKWWLPVADMLIGVCTRLQVVQNSKALTQYVYFKMKFFSVQVISCVNF